MSPESVSPESPESRIEMVSPESCPPKKIQRFTARVVAEIEGSYNIDARKIYLTGFSNGGWAAFDIGYAYPEMYRGLIIFGAGWSYTEGEEPSGKAKGRPMYIGIRTEDGNYERSKLAQEFLEKDGAFLAFRVWPGVHSGPPSEEYEAIIRWLLKTGELDDLRYNYQESVVKANGDDNKIQPAKDKLKQALSKFETGIKDAKGNPVKELEESLVKMKKSIEEELN